MTTDVQASVELTPLTGEGRPISEWTTNFHLAIVVLDPYTNESSWIIDTALRILRSYSEADVRIALMVTATVEEAREYVGPLASEILVYADPDRAAARAFGLEVSREREASLQTLDLAALEALFQALLRQRAWPG